MIALQPMVVDDVGTARFQMNAIIDWLLRTGHFDLNDLSRRTQEGQFTADDLGQIMQLLGYSAAGYCELDFVTETEKKIVDHYAQSAIRRHNERKKEK